MTPALATGPVGTNVGPCHVVWPNRHHDRVDAARPRHARPRHVRPRRRRRRRHRRGHRPRRDAARAARRPRREGRLRRGDVGRFVEAAARRRALPAADAVRQGPRVGRRARGVPAHRPAPLPLRALPHSDYARVLEGTGARWRRPRGLPGPDGGSRPRHRRCVPEGPARPTSSRATSSLAAIPPWRRCLVSPARGSSTSRTCTVPSA
jgi:hypothetical protein